MDGGDTKMRCVVVGSGNGAQTAAGLLGSEGHEVFMLFGPAYAERAEALQAALDANGGCMILEDHSAGGEPAIVRGPIAGVTTDAARVVPFADLIAISLNGPAMAPAVEQIAEHLHPEQLLLFLQGISGINYRQVVDAMGRHALTNLPTFAATKTLPWACRLQRPGRVSVLGTKADIGLALAPDASMLLRAMLPALLAGLFPGTRFRINPSPLDVTCLPYDILGNDVLHPGIMYGKWKDWDGAPLPERPLFYHGVSREAVSVIEAMQDETLAVIAALSRFLGLPAPVAVRDVRADLELCYGPRIADPSTLYSLLRTNEAYEGIYHPMKPAPDGAAGFVPNFSARLLSEDVPCGLVPIRGAAEVLGVPTPAIDRVIEWAQEKLGREYLVAGRLAGRDVAGSDAPQRFGECCGPEAIFVAGAPAAAGGAGAKPSAAAPAIPEEPATPEEASEEAGDGGEADDDASPFADLASFAEPPLFALGPGGSALGGARGPSLFSTTAPGGVKRLSLLRSFSVRPSGSLHAPGLVAHVC